ncbi:MAG: MBOAT family protein [Burkholderiales bacterium]|nr:MBOAT family protein [Burkholderiales bacterium]
MLFNSYAFIFLYLPVVLLVFFQLARINTRLAAGWLAAASLFFYGWWNPIYVTLLVASILFNYTLGMAISRARAAGDLRRSKRRLVFAVTGDLLILGYFKYANFFLDNANALLGTSVFLDEIILPLGISFFTFTQIAFLVDAYQGRAEEYNLTHYALFVTWFPHLIAGPILHHREMMPQFARPATYRPQYDNLAAGLTVFVIGLFKKVILADGIAPYVGPLFGLPQAGVGPTFFEAWAGALAYALQLYFDFSGYCDMAIGLSLMFGVRLPLNFHSPYKSASISELWQRWHMTLSRFLREYLYVPLGGNRKSAARRYFSLITTMVLCGLWHGAGWNYVLFGTLHGFYLAVHQAWRTLRKRWFGRRRKATWWSHSIAVLLTFTAWLVGAAIFRSETAGDALVMLKAMSGAYGYALPDVWLVRWGDVGAWLQAQGVAFTDSRGLLRAGLVNWIVILLAICWFAPNTQQIMARCEPALNIPRDTPPARLLAWRPGVLTALITALIAFIALVNLQGYSEFLYFQF